MLLPPGQVLHKDLNTSYTIFEDLLFDLKENRFSGYIRVNYWGYEGILILDGGKIIQGLSTGRENFLLGKDAVINVMKKAPEKDGTIEVHALLNEVSTTVAAVLGATFYRDEKRIMGENFQKIFKELESDSITGYTDIQFGGKKGFGTVYLLEGMPVESVIMSSTGRIVCGEKVYEKILEIGKFILSDLKVYRNEQVSPIMEEKVFLMPDATTPALEFWNVFINILIEQVRSVSKKNNFVNIWQSSLAEIASTYPFLDPKNKCVNWNTNHFTIQRVIPLPEFMEGMIFSLALWVQKLPSRRRKKIKMEKIISTLQTRISHLSAELLPDDPVSIVHKIFRE